MNKKEIIILILSIIGGISLILLLVLLPLAFGYLYPGEYGLIYYGINKQIDLEVYLPGRYYLGLGNKFIRFPSKYIEVDFAENNIVECFTSNLQPFNLEMKVYLKINADFAIAPVKSTFSYNLFNFYMDFGGDWQLHFKNIIANSVQQVSVNYDTLYVLENRKEYKNKIVEKLSSAIKSSSNNILSLVSLRILNIALNSELDSSIENKLIQLQKVKVFSIQDQIAQVNKTTERLQRQTQSDIDFINADATRYYNIKKINTLSSCLDLIMKNDSDTYAQLDNALSLSNDGELVNFITVLEGNSFTAQQIVNFETVTAVEK